MVCMIRVAAVDDHPLFLDGVAQVLKTADIEVVGLAAEPAAVATFVKDDSLDVLLLDIHLAGANGLDIARSISARRETLKVVILSASNDPADIATAFDAGADGYVLKDAAGDELIDAIRTVRSNRQYISNSLSTQVFRALLQARAALPAAQPWAKMFNAVELGILERASRGMTNKEIAREISREPDNIRYQMGIILRKLRVKNRVQAILQFKDPARH